MKYLKYSVAILATLFLIFLGRGFITPSISYESEIAVDKPIKEAWAVMSDESKIAQWLSGITKVEHVSGEKGKVGGVTKYTYVENGQESIVVETIKEINDDEYIVMDFTMEGAMSMDYRIDYSETDGKTDIKSSTTVRGDGMLMRSILSFMTNTMKAQEDENLANLKKLINKNTTDYFPAPVVEGTVEAIE